MNTLSKLNSQGGILAAVLGYALFATAWILLSDEWVRLMLGDDPERIILASMLKGCLYVAVTSWLLYRLLRRSRYLALRQNEVFKQAILDSVNAHIAVLDRQGLILAVNRPWLLFAEQNGLRPDEACRFAGPGVDYLAVCGNSTKAGAEEAQTVRDGITDVLEGRRQRFVLEYPCHSPTETRWFMMTATPLGQDCQGVVIAHTDITTRKQAEQAMSDSERRFRQLFTLAPLPLAIVTQDGRIVAFNERFIDTFGYTLADVPTLAEWWPAAYPDPDYRGSVMEAWNAAVQNAVERDTDILPLEFQITCRDGEPRQVVIAGIIIGREVLITFTDITERKQAEQKLKASEERLRFAMDATFEGVWDWDMRKDLAYLAPRYYEITGYRPGNITPNFEFFKRTVHPDDLPNVLDTVTRHLQGKTPASEFDYRLLTATGQIKWVSGRGQVVERDDQGAPLRMVGTITDISARKATEQTLRRQSEELAQRNEELERFNRAMVGRELDMIALKQQVNALSRQLGQAPPYPLSFLDAADGAEP